MAPRRPKATLVVSRTVKFVPDKDTLVTRAAALLGIPPATFIRGAAVVSARTCLAEQAAEQQAAERKAAAGVAPSTELVRTLQPRWRQAFALMAQLAVLRWRATADAAEATAAGELELARALREFTMLTAPPAHVEILAGGRHRLTLADGSSGLSAPPGGDDDEDGRAHRSPAPVPAEAAR
jgi:hypothetical protein